MPPSSPLHICPKCGEGQPESHFRRSGRKDTGKLAGWCGSCRATYRDRLASLKAKREEIKSGFEALKVEEVAKLEGFTNHPLRDLIGLAYILGASRALAIRDGKSWRGKAKWREYYKAKRALEGAMGPYPALDALSRLQDAAKARGTSEMSAKEIDAEIVATRRGRARGHWEAVKPSGEVVATARTHAQLLAQLATLGNPPGLGLRFRRDPKSEGVSSKGEEREP